MNLNYEDDEYDGFAIDRSIAFQVLKEFGFKPDEEDSFQAYLFACGSLTIQSLLLNT